MMGHRKRVPEEDYRQKYGDFLSDEHKTPHFWQKFTEKNKVKDVNSL